MYQKLKLIQIINLSETISKVHCIFHINYDDSNVNKSRDIFLFHSFKTKLGFSLLSFSKHFILNFILFLGYFMF